MAWGPAESSKPVLLGFIDSAMREDCGHFTINKVGGFPDWASPPPLSPPACGVCTSQLLQVAQIYAPLSGSQYHRTLHLFACLQPPCWNQSSSWVCLRSQQLDTKSINSQDSIKPSPASQPTDWLGDADDWGDEDDANGNGNLSPISPATTSTPSPVGAIGGCIPTIGTNLNLNIQDSAETLSLSHLALTEGRRTNLNDGNANISPPGRGASAPTGRQTGHTAHAEIEMEGEEDCVAIEEVGKPTTDIPGLFYRANRSLSTTGLRIEPSYLWVEEEGWEMKEETGQHEQSLLMEYKAKEALEQASEGRAPRCGDTYEKAVPSHGDEYFHKLVTVIQQNPGQVLRYSRLSDSPPLLLRPMQEKPSRCRHCGASMTFELQLLPSLVGQLKVVGLDGVPVEWGIVLLYTCLASCWEEGAGPRAEHVVVQPETM